MCWPRRFPLARAKRLRLEAHPPMRRPSGKRGEATGRTDPTTKRHMNISIRTPLAFAALSLLALAAPARATTVTECHSAIQVVRGDLAGVVIGGNNPDQTRASLDSKLTGADLKLDEAKLFD